MDANLLILLHRLYYNKDVENLSKIFNRELDKIKEIEGINLLLKRETDIQTLRDVSQKYNWSKSECSYKFIQGFIDALYMLHEKAII